MTIKKGYFRVAIIELENARHADEAVRAPSFDNLRQNRIEPQYSKK